MQALIFDLTEVRPRTLPRATTCVTSSPRWYWPRWSSRRGRFAPRAASWSGP